jgi:hypothetical protein
VLHNYIMVWAQIVRKLNSTNTPPKLTYPPVSNGEQCLSWKGYRSKEVMNEFCVSFCSNLLCVFLPTSMNE